MEHLGAQLADVGEGTCTISCRPRPELDQQHGFVHAGVVGAIADSAAGYAALSLLPAGSEVLTVEFKLNLLAPAEGDLLIARGRVAARGPHADGLRGDGRPLCATGRRRRAPSCSRR